MSSPHLEEEMSYGRHVFEDQCSTRRSKKSQEQLCGTVSTSQTQPDANREDARKAPAESWPDASEAVGVAEKAEQHGSSQATESDKQLKGEMEELMDEKKKSLC